MKHSPFLLTAALLTVAAAASAQAPRDQRMTFGGGSHFEFAIPVNAVGNVYVEARWNAGVPMHADLYAPGRPLPIAEFDGTGRLTISQNVERWSAGTPWMLRLAVSDQTPNVRGDLRIVWPGGNRPGVVTLWRNAGPTDPAVLAAASRRIGTLKNIVGASAATGTSSSTAIRIWDHTAYAEMLDILQTRLEVLAATPARFVANDSLMTSNGTTPPAGDLGRASSLTVAFNALRVEGNSRYHFDHERDAPYVVAAILPGGEGRVVAGRSAVFTAAVLGEDNTAPNGGQYLARINAAPTHVAVAVLERERGNPDQAMARFLRAVELFSLYRTMDGATLADADFPWFAELTVSAGGEAMIGTPRLLSVTAKGIQDAAGLASDWQRGSNGLRLVRPALAFAGRDGAMVEVALSIATDQR